MPRLEVALGENPAWNRLSIPKNIDLNQKTGKISKPLALPYKPGTLSVVMIVKNEAKNIEAAVESFRSIADEIIVNDTGSTDGTQQLLEGLGVKWFQGDWRGDFSYARNLAIDQATSSWILWLDADDRIPKDQVENFQKLKTAPLDRAFGFQVINTQAGLPLGGRFMQIRMFPNHPDLRFRYRIHEQVVHAIAGLGLHLFYTDTTLHHTGYEEPELKKSKARRNLELLAGETERMRDEPSLAMSVGDSHYILGEWEKGIEAYRQVWEIPQLKEMNSDIHAEIPCCIGIGLQRLRQFEEAIAWYAKSFALQPAKVEPLFHQAECLLDLGRKAEAEILLRKVIGMPMSYTSTANQYDIVRIYAYWHLAHLLFDRGEVEATRDLLETMHGQYDQVVESWQLLGQCHLKLGNSEAALKCLSQALSINPRASLSLHHDRLKLLTALGKTEEYRVALALAHEHFPQVSFSQRPLLSLCMIVKNERSNLPACLESVQGLADEIIVVDTGSSDGTQGLAQSFGAKVIQTQWQDDFSLARNLSLAHATGEWILWLDADDRVLPADKKALKELVHNQKPERAFGLMVKNSVDGGITGTVFNQIRLFPNRSDLRFCSPIHEQILPALEKAKLPVTYLSIRVLHTGYGDPELAKSKQARNRKILEAQIEKQEGITPVTLYTLGNACFDLGDYAEALGWFEQCLELAKKQGTDPHLQQQAPIKMAATLAQQGRAEEAGLMLDRHFPPTGSVKVPAEGLLVRAQILAVLNHPAEAASAYEALLDLEEQPTFIPVDVVQLKVKALQYLGSYWYDRGQRELAKRLLRMGIAAAQGAPASGIMLKSLYAEFEILPNFPLPPSPSSISVNSIV